MQRLNAEAVISKYEKTHGIIADEVLKAYTTELVDTLNNAESSAQAERLADFLLFVAQNIKE